jgi:hypothetical protein
MASYGVLAAGALWCLVRQNVQIHSGNRTHCSVFWPSPERCKTSTPGSNPGGASNFFLQ